MTPTAEWYEADADDSDRSITDDVTANAHETARAATEAGETGARVHGDADLLKRRTAALDRVAAENERLRAEVEQWRTVYERANDWSWEQASRAEAAEAKLRDVEAERDALRADMEALADEWANLPHPEGAESVQDWVYRMHVKSLGAILRAVLARSQAEGTRQRPECTCGGISACLVCQEADEADARSRAPQAPAEQERRALPEFTPRSHNRGGCSCGSPEAYSLNSAEVVVHRLDGPCYIAPSVRPATADDEGVTEVDHETFAEAAGNASIPPSHDNDEAQR